VGGFRLEDRIELSGIVGAFAGLAFLFAPRESQ
jgi:hypothetical protein